MAVDWWLKREDGGVEQMVDGVRMVIRPRQGRRGYVAEVRWPSGRAAVAVFRTLPLAQTWALVMAHTAPLPSNRSRQLGGDEEA